MATSPHLVPKMLPQYAQDSNRPYEGDPWERQAKETSRSFDAFTHYRDTPPNERTIANTGRWYTAKHGVKSGQAQMYAWSRSHRWVERAEAYDAWNDAKSVAAHRRTLIRSATKHAEQAAAVQEILMQPVDEYRRRIEEAGGADIIKDLDDVSVLKLASAFSRELPAIQRAERDALSSTSGVSVGPKEIKAKGEIVRKMLANPSLLGVIEKLSFEVTETGGEPESA